MNIIKRSGAETQFDLAKITAAVEKANDSVPDNEKMSKEQIAVISANMRTICEGMNRALSVEDFRICGERYDESEGFFCCPELYYLSL